MKIHWVTFACQVVNFFVLVFLLRRFLYQPIIEAMDNREAKIAAQLEDAEKAQIAAEDAEKEFKKQRKELDEKRSELMAQAEQEAEGRKKDLVHKARAEVDDLQTRWRESLRQEKESFLKELRQRSGEQLWAMARRILSDLANAELERQIVDVFVDRVNTLEETVTSSLKEVIASKENAVNVHSSFALPESSLNKVSQALKDKIDKSMNINFIVSDDVVAGIELKASGHKIAWSVGDYLQDLEDKLADAVEDEVARTASLATPTPKVSDDEREVTEEIEEQEEGATA
mgnify:FL=1